MQPTPQKVTVVVERARRLLDKDSPPTPPLVRRIETELQTAQSTTIHYINSRLSHQELWTEIENANTTFILFVKEGHDWSPHLLPKLVEAAQSSDSDLTEPYTFTTPLPNNPSWAAQQSQYDYHRDISIYGKVFKVDKLKAIRETASRVDKTNLYLTYRLSWKILNIQPLDEAYTSNNLMLNSNGLTLKRLGGTILPLTNSTSLELRRGILRLIILALRRLRQRAGGSVSIGEIANAARHYNLAPLIGLARQQHIVEALWILWLIEPNGSGFLTKELTHYDLYTHISTKPDTNHYLSARVNTIRTADATTYIYREYRPKTSRDRNPSPEVYDFYNRPINSESTILLFDRPTAADDNAEHLYRYIQREMPQYKNIYFALNQTSHDWDRLSEDGFNMVKFYSPEFDQLFLRSDVIISSQLLNISRSGKDFTNSRFVYLQHGIQLNDMTSWLTSSHFDIIVSTGELESEYLRSIAPVETLKSGMPRLQYLSARDGWSNQITYMPTWNFKNHGLSHDDFLRTQTVKQINDVLRNRRLQNYLVQSGTLLKVKLHPNLQDKSAAFYTNDQIQITDANYQDLIETSDLIFTDYSSVALDAAFAQVPIAFYQPDAKNFYRSQIYQARLSYQNLGLGPVFTKSESLVSYIINDAYRHDREVYTPRINKFFEIVDKDSICEKIMTRVLTL